MASSSTQPSSSSSSSRRRGDGVLHLIGGGVGGMCGAIVTSPLDVVKTRLQSDMYASRHAAQRQGITTRRLAQHFVETGGLLREIATKEGPRALFKGLGPTLVGVVPARSINFFTYGNSKAFLAEINDGKETAVVHLCAAAFAGLVTATATNPIWVVKTRLQLRHQAETAAIEAKEAARAGASIELRSSQLGSRRGRTPYSTHALSPRPFFEAKPAPRKPALNSMQTLTQIVRSEGVVGLYKGLSASYLGVAEGTIQWVMYEQLKSLKSRPDEGPTTSTTIGAAAAAKLVASLVTYPHEVLRTRLRQEPPSGQARKYVGLAQTVRIVFRDEGFAAFYGGLSAHLLRVVPVSEVA